MKKKFIFTIITILTIILIFLTMHINAESEVIGNYDISATSSDSVTATLYDDGGEYSIVISGSGNMKDFESYNDKPWSEYCSGYSSKLKKVVVEDGVTNIGDYAFHVQYGLKEVNLPDTVTKIGENAFTYCKFTDLIMSDNIVSLGESAFLGCDIENLKISKGLTEISNSAFSGTSITQLEIPGNIKTIGEQAFYDCDGLTYVYIPENVQTIGNSAFSVCNNLEVIEIASGVTNIGYIATNCENLIKLTIPSSVQIIDSSSYSIVNKSENVTVYFNSNTAAQEHFAEYEVSCVVDDNAPEIANIIFSETDWTNQDVTITIEATDEASGLSKYAYSFDGGATWQAENYKTYTENTEGIVIKVKDCLYNTLEYPEVINITNIDKVYPTIEAVTGNATDWTNQDVTLTISATDDLSGLGEDAYSFDGGATWQEENYKTYSENIDGIEIQIKDRAGNITQHNEIINITKIDKEPPTVEKVTGNPTEWTNENVTLTTEGKDNLSGVIAYSFDGGATWQEDITKIYEENTSGIFVKVKDAAGNESELTEEISITMIDKQSPELENITGNVSEWTNENVTLTIEGSDNLSGVTEYSFDGGVTWQSESSKTYEANTPGIVVKVKDAAGNESELSEEINITQIDKDKPTVENVTGNPTEWTNQNVTLTIEGSDDLSGVVAYSFDGGVTWQEESSKIYETNTEGIVVKVKDAAGNESEVIEEINITKIDKENPTVENVTGNPTEWTNENVTLTIEGRDDLSGVVAYSFDGGVTWQEESSKIYEANTPGIVVKVKDAAGNESELSEEINITQIDKDKPTVENVTGNPTEWTNENVTLTIEGSDDLSGVVAYSFDGGVTWQAESSKTYEANTLGIVVKVKDAAGNESEVSEVINIIKIRKPEGLEITTIPRKMEYEAYENFDSTEMVITIIYNNGDEEPTTEYEIINGESLTCQVTKIEIQYNENPELKVVLEGIKVGHAEVELAQQAETCTNTGLTQGKYCEVCNEVLVAQETIPALGHNYENGKCTRCKEEVIIDVTSEQYKIENSHISKIASQTTLDQFKANIQSNAAEINIYNKKGELLTGNDVIGTGMQLKVTLGGKTETYPLIITGDANGDGDADFKDLVKVNSHRLNKTLLKDEYLLAADVNGDGVADFKDMVKINQFRLHKTTEL